MVLHGFTQLPFWLMLAAFVVATYVYIVQSGDGRTRSSVRCKPLWTVLDRKYWMDEIHYALFASGGVKLGRLLWKCGDAAMIDEAWSTARCDWCIACGVAAAAADRLSVHYAFVMIVGVIVLLGGYGMVRCSGN